VDWNGMGGGVPNAEIILEMDRLGFIEFIADGLK
jgi:hypothetical protein